jgi:hypothetical protein
MPRSPYPSTSVRECHPFYLLSCHGPSSRFPDVVVLQMYRIPAIRFSLNSCTLQSSVGQPCTGPTGKTRKIRRTDDHLLPDDTASDAVFPGQPSMTFQNVLAKTPTISPSLICLGSTRSPNTLSSGKPCRPRRHKERHPWLAVDFSNRSLRAKKVRIRHPVTRCHWSNTLTWYRRKWFSSQVWTPDKGNGHT